MTDFGFVALIHEQNKPLRTHEADQLIVPGQRQTAVHGIHPPDRPLHAPAAEQHAQARVNGIDPLCRHGGVCEGGKAGGQGGSVKVGRGERLLHSLRFSQGL